MPIEKLKTLLNERGVSQTELAELLGRDKAVVTNLLKGRRQLKADEAVRIAQRLGVSVDVILGGGEPPAPAGLGESAWIPFQQEPVRVKDASQVSQREGRYFLEESAHFGPKAYALEVRDYSLNMLGILPGDVVISALDVPVEKGKVAIIQHYEGAGATTLLRRYDPPLLTAHSTNPSHKHFAADDENIRIVSPVLKLVRLG